MPKYRLDLDEIELHHTEDEARRAARQRPRWSAHEDRRDLIAEVKRLREALDAANDLSALDGW